mgnify:CR=1 FL=1
MGQGLSTRATLQFDVGVATALHRSRTVYNGGVVSGIRQTPEGVLFVPLNEPVTKLLRCKDAYSGFNMVIDLDPSDVDRAANKCNVALAKLASTVEPGSNAFDGYQHPPASLYRNSASSLGLHENEDDPSVFAVFGVKPGQVSCRMLSERYDFIKTGECALQYSPVPAGVDQTYVCHETKDAELIFWSDDND